VALGALTSVAFARASFDVAALAAGGTGRAVTESEVAGALPVVVVVQVWAHGAEWVSAACAWVAGVVARDCFASGFLVVVAVAGLGGVARTDRVEAVRHQRSAARLCGSVTVQSGDVQAIAFVAGQRPCAG